MFLIIVAFVVVCLLCFVSVMCDVLRCVVCVVVLCVCVVFLCVWFVLCCVVLFVLFV